MICSVWRCRPGSDVGSAAAEFAVTIPAVLLVLGISIGAITTAAKQMSLETTVASAVRAESRGELPEIISQIIHQSGGVVSWNNAEGYLCGTVTSTAMILGTIPIDLSAESCALEEGS